VKILVLNAGSTSVKLDLVDLANEMAGVLYSQTCSTAEETQTVLEELLCGELKPDLIAHRIVHGGTKYSGACVIDGKVEEDIESLAALAPLHNREALRWIRRCREKYPFLVQVASFDTAFFSQMPAVARDYAIPPDVALRAGIRRYGFHGLAHQSLWQQWSAERPDLIKGGKMISVHLGGGCSVAAISGGKPLDNSMGFTPLEGLMMATRCGDLDAAVVLHLIRNLGWSADQVEQFLNQECGLLGYSGTSKHVGELLQDLSPRNQQALDLYAYRIRQYIGAYLAVLDGADGIVFGGGVGEHNPAVRLAVLEKMVSLGIEIDVSENEKQLNGAGKISSAQSRVDLRVFPVEERRVIAMEAKNAWRPALTNNKKCPDESF